MAVGHEFDTLQQIQGDIVISGIFGSIDNALAQNIKFNTVANNIANVNTNGFKKDLAFKVTSLPQAHGMMSYTDFSQGEVISTGNPLDIALSPRGFFKIETGQGERYSQNGAFTLNSQGFLVTGDGNRVLGENGPLAIGNGVVKISRNGEVFVDGQSVDRLAVVDFASRENLVKEENSTFSFSGPPGDIIASPNDVIVQQGYLEKSNVEPTEEMIKMIEMFRNYESSQKMIHTLSEITDKMINGFGLE